MDLMALADALLLPEDDLALATVLKSPLFGLDEDDLFALGVATQGFAARGAAHAGRATSRGSRQRTPSSIASPTGRCAIRRSRSMRACSDRSAAAASSSRGSAPRPTTRSTNSSISRSTTSARETPSLQGFVAWLRTARTDVKRDMEIDRDEVRVMTVHGAKGLEAPIVILADTTTPPAGPQQHQPRLLKVPANGRPPEAPPPFVWAGLKATDTPLIATAKDGREGRGGPGIPAAALCRHDARHRPVGGVRRSRAW